jgi:hypothetical protein
MSRKQSRYSRTVRPEDLEPGDFIVVFDRHREESEASMFNPWAYAQHNQNDGRPYVILALALPYIAVADMTSDRKTALDLRVDRVRIVSEEYAEACATSEVRRSRLTVDVTGKTVIDKRGRRRKEKEEKEPNICPRCHARVVELRTQVAPGKFKWIKTCTGCGISGDDLTNLF